MVYLHGRFCATNAARARVSTVSGGVYRSVDLQLRCWMALPMKCEKGVSGRFWDGGGGGSLRPGFVRACVFGVSGGVRRSVAHRLVLYIV